MKVCFLFIAVNPPAFLRSLESSATPGYRSRSIHDIYWETERHGAFKLAQIWVTKDERGRPGTVVSSNKTNRDGTLNRSFSFLRGWRYSCLFR
jgi:hypothetical protein